jgi:DNA polymerase I-like protein with 3'-5' exonuclease and polymerase domains
MNNSFELADVQQLELRLLLSGHKTNELDLHKAKAAELYKVPVESVTPTMRKAGKMANFHSMYFPTNSFSSNSNKIK